MRYWVATEYVFAHQYYCSIKKVVLYVAWMALRQKAYDRKLARAEKLLRKELAKRQSEYKYAQVSSIDLSDRWRVRIVIKGEKEKLVDATGWYSEYIRSGNRHRKKQA